jgi:hypothetical protein
MGDTYNERRRNWVPEACTLPTAEVPLRVAEFGGLFADAVHGIERVGPTRLRLELQASPQVAGRAAALVAAETECCSFFTFTLTATGGGLALEASVPAGHTGVLDGLADLAAAAAGRAA